MYRRYKRPLFRNPANVGYIRAEPSNAILENCILPKYNKQPTTQKITKHKNVDYFIVLIAIFMFILYLLY